MENSILYLKQIYEKQEDKVFLIDSRSGASYKYEQVFQSSKNIAYYLKQQGIKKGDRVAILLNNGVNFAKIYFGCLYLGTVAVPINPTLDIEHARFVLINSNAKLLITSSEITFYDDFQKKTNTLIINPDESIDEIINLKNPSIEEALSFCADVDVNDELIMVYTSGTTASPKGVVHTYESLISNGRSFIETMQIGENSRFYNILPMSYLGGYYNLLLIPFLAGGSVVIQEAFNAVNLLQFWKPVIQYNINTLWIVPTIAAMLLELDRGSEGADYCRWNSVVGLIGTAPASKELLDKFEEKYFKLYENYALSETLFITTNRPNHKEQAGVGACMEGISIKIVDKHNNEMKNNEEGEVYVKTFSLMKGYHTDVLEDVATLLIDGWLPTGDMGLVTDANHLIITGRKKDLIIKGGINISPAYIENMILKYPDVQECCIIGIPHKIMGEEIICVLRVSDHHNWEAMEPEIKQFIDSSLPLAYRPSHILQLHDFPRTSSGKIQKQKIREWVAIELKL